ncbi:EfeM/EfeO family lipoprotein [Subtercola sp. PAMC28395]|uniref:iron uptake system protein EfeO n=1 Tax=Subtercola sp. PAMC28395 TaxID=2846775 RepID=UPI001C0CD67A|nr:iron uptake system protein EfeO [Subtercola sp. PAMC28395]QWT23700.1 EfeM/EfeO family lipoprotein [Subtercola sp. PAMC28395]
MTPSTSHSTVRLTLLAAVVAGSMLLTGCTAGSSAGSSVSSGSSAAPVANGAAQVAVTLTGSQCTLDHTTAPAGPVTFTVTNTDAAGLSEVELMSDKRILGERENIVAGLKPATFTVTLSGGTYALNCPGATSENTTFTVTGAATTPASDVQGRLTEGTSGYGSFIEDQAAGLVAAVATFDAAIQAGDVAAAKKAYAAARPFYERIEPVAESFADLDPQIDARVADVAPGTAWTGFHPIEKDLFDTGAIADTTKALSTKLVADIAQLQTLTTGLSYKPEELANGASSLLEEVQSSKITGEEEAYSHIDLVDFAANIEGSEQAFEYLKPALTTIDPDLTTTISGQFESVDALLASYADTSALGGFVLYTDTLKASDATKLTQAIQALQAPLAQLAEKVATA